ncbi:MAG: hypothetical protein ACFFDM_13435 [Candidatus Thorarchaeota archaeon]
MVRKYYWAAVIGFLFVISSASEVSATHSQNLHWGYEEGQGFTFIYRRHFENDEVIIENENYFLLVGPEHPSIEDPLTNDSYTPFSRFDVYWANDSSLDEENWQVGLHLAVPIGNWSLLSKVLEASFNRRNVSEYDTYSFQIIDTINEWGYNTTSTRSTSDGSSTRFTYSKLDGVLLELVDYSWSWSNSTIRSTLSRLPMNPRLQAILTTGLALGIVIVVIVLVTWIRRK